MVKLTIACNYLKRSFKDYIGILIMIILPLAFTFIIGKAMEGALNPKIDTFSVNNVPADSMRLQEFLASSEKIAFVDEIILAPLKQISTMQYFASSMLVMFMLFTGSMGASNLINEREENTLMRTMAAPVKESDILAGKFMGTVMVALAQAAVIILVNKLLFKVDWGSSPFGILVMTIAIVYVSASIAFLFSMVIHSGKMASGITTVVILLMSFLGGSFTPVDNNSAMDTLSYFTINRWAFDGYQKIMAGGALSSISVNLLVLLGTGTILTVLSIILFKHRGSLYE